MALARPPAGNYLIYNRVLSPTGQKLAITFQGADQYATVEPFGYNKSQVWKLQDYDAYTQAIVPVEATSLQAAWGDQGVKVIEAGNYVWAVRDGDEGYTIQDGDLTAEWGITKGYAGEKITIGKDYGVPNQRWVFEKVAEY